MRQLLILTALLALASVSFADDEQLVCPKYIEVPLYPPIPRAAHVSGDVVIRGTLDGEGAITKVELVSGPPLLLKSSLDAVQAWTFSKPPQIGRAHV